MYDIYLSTRVYDVTLGTETYMRESLFLLFLFPTTAVGRFRDCDSFRLVVQNIY